MPGDYLSSLNFEREVYGMEFEDIQEKFLTTDMIRFYIDRESLNTKQFRLIEALDEVKSKMKFE